MLYRLVIDIEGGEEAKALADLIKEMGYSVNRYPMTRTKKLVPSQTRIGQLALSHMLPGRSYRAEDFISAFADRGFKQQSVQPLLSALVAEGAIKRIDRGLYQRIVK